MLIANLVTDSKFASNYKKRLKPIFKGIWGFNLAQRFFVEQLLSMY